MDSSFGRLTRRQFVAQAGMAAAGLTILRRTAAADRQRLIVGAGPYTYECIHDWLMPPNNIKYGYTHGVTQDSRGRIYLAHTVHPSSPSKDGILVFDPHGKFMTSWGAQFVGGAHGLDVRKEGREEFLYHCDIAHHTVTKTTLKGEVVWQKGVPTETDVYQGGKPFVPTNVAFAPNGDFYVADGYGSNWIHQYNLKGEYIRTFGGTGTEPGKFHTCHGLWVDRRSGKPALAVTDRENHRIEYFTLEGKPTSVYTEGIRRPCSFDTRGDLLLIADLNSVVTLLDKDDKVVAQLGDGAAPDGTPSNLDGVPRDKFLPGKFIHPHDAAFLHNGDILVAEWVPIGRVTLLRRVT